MSSVERRRVDDRQRPRRGERPLRVLREQKERELAAERLSFGKRRALAVRYGQQRDLIGERRAGRGRRPVRRLAAVRKRRQAANLARCDRHGRERRACKRRINRRVAAKTVRENIRQAVFDELFGAGCFGRRLRRIGRQAQPEVKPFSGRRALTRCLAAGRAGKEGDQRGRPALRVRIARPVQPVGLGLLFERFRRGGAFGERAPVGGQRAEQSTVIGEAVGVHRHGQRIARSVERAGALQSRAQGIIILERQEKRGFLDHSGQEEQHIWRIDAPGGEIPERGFVHLGKLNIHAAVPLFERGDAAVQPAGERT